MVPVTAKLPALTLAASCRNHETMNVASRFRYSTDDGMEDFAAYAFMQSLASALKVGFIITCMLAQCSSACQSVLS